MSNLLNDFLPNYVKKTDAKKLMKNEDFAIAIHKHL